jgi:hypothetical protein
MGPVGILRERLPQNLPAIARQPGLELCNWPRQVAHNRRQDRHVGVAGEGGERPSAFRKRRHPARTDPSGDRSISLLPAPAICRRRCRGFGHRPSMGGWDRGRARFVPICGRLAQLRQAEVEDPHAPICRDHHVLWLQVSMRDPARVRRAHGIGERNRDREKPLERQAILRNQRIERLPFHQLHRQEPRAVRTLFALPSSSPIGVRLPTHPLRSSSP